MKNCFNNKTIVVTGHTGFKGSWLISWLDLLGANVIGIALDPPTGMSHFSAAEMAKDITDIRLDIRDSDALEKVFIRAQPDFVFHLADLGDLYKNRLQQMGISTQDRIHTPHLTLPPPDFYVVLPKN